MIFPKDIQRAVVARLAEAFPGETVYEDLVPRDFRRPSNLVELVKTTVEETGTRSLLFHYLFRVTTFAVVDEIHNTHFALLDLRSFLIMSQLAPGYLAVGERVPRITKIAADHSSADFATVSFTVDLPYDRTEFDPGEVYEIMQDLAVNTSLKGDNQT